MGGCTMKHVRAGGRSLHELDLLEVADSLQNRRILYMNIFPILVFEPLAFFPSLANGEGWLCLNHVWQQKEQDTKKFDMQADKDEIPNLKSRDPQNKSYVRLAH